MARSLTQFHQGRQPRPNIYKRSEAQENTDAYFAEIQRKAAGVDEPPPFSTMRSTLIATALIVFATLGGVALLVGVFIMREEVL